MIFPLYSTAHSSKSNNLPPASSINSTSRQGIDLTVAPTTPVLNGSESTVQVAAIQDLNPETYISTGIAMLGAALGRNGCAQKAACYAATLIPPTIKGKEMIIM